MWMIAKINKNQSNLFAAELKKNLQMLAYIILKFYIVKR